MDVFHKNIITVFDGKFFWAVKYVHNKRIHCNRVHYNQVGLSYGPLIIKRPNAFLTSPLHGKHLVGFVSETILL